MKTVDEMTDTGLTLSATAKALDIRMNVLNKLIADHGVQTDPINPRCILIRPDELVHLCEQLIARESDRLARIQKRIVAAKRMAHRANQWLEE